MFGNNDGGECCVCKDARSSVKRVHLAGEIRDLCLRCDAVRASLEVDGVLEWCSHCLHLFAMDVEAVGARLGIIGYERSWFWRVRSRLNAGDVRLACPCPRCRSNYEPEPFAVVDGPVRSQSEVKREREQTLTANKAETVHFGPVPDGLAARAQPGWQGEWVSVWNVLTGEVGEAFVHPGWGRGPR